MDTSEEAPTLALVGDAGGQVREAGEAVRRRVAEAGMQSGPILDLLRRWSQPDLLMDRYGEGSTLSGPSSSGKRWRNRHTNQTKTSEHRDTNKRH